MGLTMTEKILLRHSEGDSLGPDRRISVKPDRIFLSEKELPALLQQDPSREGAKPELRDRVVAGLDQCISKDKAERLGFIRAARDLALGSKPGFLYELGRGGIAAVLLPDSGQARPGDLVVGLEEQILALGACGAAAFRVEPDSLPGLLESGMLTVQVPETVKLVFRGAPGQWVNGKDFAIHAWGLLGASGVRGKTLEFAGEAVSNLDLSDRLALASFASGLGAFNVIIQADEKTRVFCRARSDRAFRAEENDADACFADIIEVDAGTLDPLVFSPSSEERVIQAEKVKSLKVDQVIIGTGGNGRIEDIRNAAALIREHPIRKSVRLILIPGSQQVFLHAMEEGLIQIFTRSGAHIGLPSEGYAAQCHLYGMAPGERTLSTSGRIYLPDQLGEGRDIVYANPFVAASSAVMGFVVEPYEMLRTVKRSPTGLVG